MSRPVSIDVVVLGAGPSGSTLARQLCRLGYRVALVHHGRRAAARPPRWETLSAVALDIVRTHHPEAARSLSSHLVTATTFRKWSGADPMRWAGQERRATLVDRAVFDEALQRSAQAAGAVLVDSPVRPRDLAGHTGAWTIAGEGRTWRAPFLVDACGRRSPVNLRRRIMGPRLLAIESQWTGAALPKWSTHLEALPSAWLWAARLGTDTALITFVVAAASHGDGTGGAGQARLLLRDSQLSEGAPLLQGPPRVREATASVTPSPVGRTYLRVGDAALAYDPMASQGVQHGLISGVQGAAAINTILLRPESYGLVTEFIERRLREDTAVHVRHAREAYALQSLYQSPFWSDCSAVMDDARLPGDLNPPISSPYPIDRVVVSPGITCCTTAALMGDFIEPVRALYRPGWEAPIAFFGALPSIDVIEDLKMPISKPGLVQRWTKRFGFSAATGRELFDRLVAQGILVAAVSSSKPAATLLTT